MYRTSCTSLSGRNLSHCVFLCVAQSGMLREPWDLKRRKRNWILFAGLSAQTSRLLKHWLVALSWVGGWDTLDFSFVTDRASQSHRTRTENLCTLRWRMSITF